MGNMPNLAKLIGDRLKALRGEMNQDEFAESLGFQLRTYHRYEIGERIAPDELIEKVLAKFNLTLDEFLSGKREVKVFSIRAALAAIPDEVYNLAASVPLDDKAWQTVEDALSIAAERVKKQQLSKKKMDA